MTAGCSQHLVEHQIELPASLLGFRIPLPYCAAKLPGASILYQPTLCCTAFEQCLAHLVVCSSGSMLVSFLQDLPRTFPRHAWLSTSDGQAALKAVLMAYAGHNPDVGYCQVR